MNGANVVFASDESDEDGIYQNETVIMVSSSESDMFSDGGDGDNNEDTYHSVEPRIEHPLAQGDIATSAINMSNNGNIPSSVGPSSVGQLTLNFPQQTNGNNLPHVNLNCTTSGATTRVDNIIPIDNTAAPIYVTTSVASTSGNSRLIRSEDLNLPTLPHMPIMPSSSLGVATSPVSNPVAYSIDDVASNVSVSTAQTPDNINTVLTEPHTTPSNVTVYQNQSGSFRIKDEQPDVINSEEKCSVDKGDDEEEGQCCPICFETWTNSGEHRIASLKCGHLFGQSCIQKWLKGQGGKCPQCNTKAHKKDIRIIFAKTIQMSDTSEKDRAKEDLEKEKQSRKKAELECAEAKLNFKKSVDELNQLKAELERYRTNMDMIANPIGSNSASSSNASASQSLNIQNDRGSFIMDRVVKVSESGGARVMAYNHYTGALCISQPSSNALFPGFGIKKLNSLDFKTSQYIAVHSKPIRDIAFQCHATTPYMLTCSVDKTVKVSSLNSNTVVQTYNCPFPVWSCVWDGDNSNYLYAGYQNGTVSLFDMRNTSQHVQQIKTSSRSPVISLQYVQKDLSAVFKCSGLIMGQLDKCSFSEKLQDLDSKIHVLPIEGSLTSLHFEDTSRHVLSTLRPNSKNPAVRHQIFKMASHSIGQDDVSNNLCSCDFIHTFSGGSTQKLLSKNRLISHPSGNGNLFVCACDESSQSVHIWDATTGGFKQKLPNNSAVLDICSVVVGEVNYLICLTEKQAAIYKWN